MAELRAREGVFRVRPGQVSGYDTSPGVCACLGCTWDGAPSVARTGSASSLNVTAPPSGHGQAP